MNRHLFPGRREAVSPGSISAKPHLLHKRLSLWVQDLALCAYPGIGVRA